MKVSLFDKDFGLSATQLGTAMGARTKLNVAYAAGDLLVAVAVGLLCRSWAVGVAAFAALMAGGLATGELRLRPRGR